MPLGRESFNKLLFLSCILFILEHGKEPAPISIGGAAHTYTGGFGDIYHPILIGNGCGFVHTRGDTCVLPDLIILLGTQVREQKQEGQYDQ